MSAQLKDVMKPQRSLEGRVADAEWAAVCAMGGL